MSIIFEAILSEIESRIIIRIPLSASEPFPSRGMVMVQGTINNVPFIAPLEPDGKGSHWFEVSDNLSKEAKLIIGQTVSLNLKPIDEWIEPDIPDDMINALIKANLMNSWNSITIKSRWDWLRWIRSTKNPVTRQKRINVACSKLQNGDKRPCCFDRSRCTVTDVSKSGVLLD